ncbi:hypothetical protein CPC08DRAFT_755764 [Agrocybe pediades]|nr:hypothetical protein CPC08DRAFT_755764 [Agrocybe pediades]
MFMRAPCVGVDGAGEFVFVFDLDLHTLEKKSIDSGMHNYPVEALSDDSESVLPPQPPLLASASEAPPISPSWARLPPTHPNRLSKNTSTTHIRTRRSRAALLLSGTPALTRRASSSAMSSGGGVSSRASSVDVLGAGVAGKRKDKDKDKKKRRAMSVTTPSTGNMVDGFGDKPRLIVHKTYEGHEGGHDVGGWVDLRNANDDDDEEDELDEDGVRVRRGGKRSSGGARRASLDEGEVVVVTTKRVKREVWMWMENCGP